MVISCKQARDVVLRKKIRISNREKASLQKSQNWEFYFCLLPSFQVTKDDFMTFDYILCMDENNLR